MMLKSKQNNFEKRPEQLPGIYIPPRKAHYLIIIILENT